VGLDHSKNGIMDMIIILDIVYRLTFHFLSPAFRKLDQVTHEEDSYSVKPLRKSISGILTMGLRMTSH
jgi:hypothetical protein